MFCSVLLPLFTVAGTDRCEEDVNIACGLYLLVEEEKLKKNPKILDSYGVPCKRRGRKISHSVWTFER
jgi:hypothetical protein